MVAFRDIDKRAGDVLRVGFCHDKPWTVAVNHSGDNPKFSAMGMMTTGNVLDATPSVRYSKSGVTVEAKAGSTGSASVDVRCEVPASVKSSVPLLPLFNGLTLTSNMSRRVIKSVPTDTTDLAVEYRNDKVHGRWNLNPYTSAWGVQKCFTIGGIAENGTLMAGGSVNGSGKDVSALNYTVGVGFTKAAAKPWALAVKASPHQKTPFGSLTGSFFAASEKGHSIAAEVNHTLTDNSTKVTLGSMVYLDAKKQTWVKAKLMPSAQIATVLSHKFSDNLTGSFGAQFSSAPQSTDPVTYGMKLAVTC